MTQERPRPGRCRSTPLVVSLALATILAGCGASGIPLGESPAADSYLVAVRDSTAVVVAIDTEAQTVVPSARVEGDGQQIIHSEMVGMGERSADLVVVRRNAGTDVIRLFESGTRTQVLKRDLNTGLVASNGMDLAWVGPKEDGDAHALHLVTSSGDVMTDLDFAPTHLAVGDGRVLYAGEVGGGLRVEERDLALTVVSHARHPSGRPLALETGRPPRVVVAGLAAVSSTPGADTAGLDVVVAVASSTVADSTGPWTAYDTTVENEQAVVVEERAKGRRYRVPVPAGELLLGVHVTAGGSVALAYPSQVTFAKPDQVPVTVKLPGETATQWR